MNAGQQRTTAWPLMALAILLLAGCATPVRTSLGTVSCFTQACKEEALQRARDHDEKLQREKDQRAAEAAAKEAKREEAEAKRLEELRRLVPCKYPRWIGPGFMHASQEGVQAYVMATGRLSWPLVQTCIGDGRRVRVLREVTPDEVYGSDGWLRLLKDAGIIDGREPLMLVNEASERDWVVPRGHLRCDGHPEDSVDEDIELVWHAPGSHPLKCFLWEPPPRPSTEPPSEAPGPRPQD